MAFIKPKRIVSSVCAALVYMYIPISEASIVW